MSTEIFLIFRFSYSVESLEYRGISDFPVRKIQELDKLSNCLGAFADDIEKSSTNILLKDL